MQKMNYARHAAAAGMALFALASPLTAKVALADEIDIVITHVKALDAFDELSKGDTFAKVTIGKDVQSTPVISQQAEIKPDWKIVQKVKPGKHDVKVEIFDKDVSVDDAIDINKVANRRPLEFTVDTRSCRIEGFSQTYKCGDIIKRAGEEKKKAEITFVVKVKK
jgi:hypothetical protein